MKKFFLIFPIALVMVMSAAIPSFAISYEAVNEKNVQTKDYAIATYIREKNTNGDLVHIKIDENIVDEIKKDNIEEILNDGLGTIKEYVQIISSETVKKEGLDLTAGGSYYIFTKDKKMIGINVLEDVLINDTNILLDLFEDDNVSDGDIITLQNIVETEDVNNDSIIDVELNPEAKAKIDKWQTFTNQKIDLSAPIYYIKTSKAAKSGEEHVCKDKFIISVAKGETVKLGKDFRCSVKTTLSAGSKYFDLTEIQAGLTTPLNCKISKTTTYNSKNMPKGKNCREFRVKYYKQNYMRTQKKYLKLTDKLLETKKATINKPTKYLMYSIDRYVE